jgi:sugar O-acyltransferase (sialic acid O-acetyltransferase NeuD family)
MLEVNVKKKIVLIGGGGHCVSCIDVIESTDEYEVYGILDVPEKMNQKVLNYTIIGTDSSINEYAERGFGFIITAGQIKSYSIRKRLFQAILSANGRLETIKAKTACVSKYAEIGGGTIIMHNAIVNARAKIGRNCIINSNALVEHDTVIADHVHVSTMAVINGGCTIGEGCFIGSNVVINQEMTISKEAIIGAGSVVNKVIFSPGIYAGNPYKLISKKGE